MPPSDQIPFGDTPPLRIDTTTPNVARVYDALLGGKDNFEVDRAVLRQLLEIAPEGQTAVREGRDWLVRVVRYLADRVGLSQFLDCGSGMPTAENTHQIAQRFNPDAQVVYVDRDPVVEAHSRALLEENDRTHFVNADLTEPCELLSHRTILRYLDLDHPLALLQCGTLHHINDTATARKVMAGYIAALPSGSYVALTHAYDAADGSPRSALARKLEAKLQETLGVGRYRTRNEILSFLDGLELLDPGLVFLHEWWPEGPRSTEIPEVSYTTVGAVGRKP